jgi:hypothetical protein
VGDESIVELIAGVFWPSEPTTQTAILLLGSLAVAMTVTVYAPLWLRLFRLDRLLHAVKACFDEETANTAQRRELAKAFADSPLAAQWTEFVRRWRNSVAADPAQDASLPELSRAPVRLSDVLDEQPLLPIGSRRSLLPALPAFFLSAGLMGAFSGLVLSLPEIGLSLDPPSFEETSRSHQISTLMGHLGMALRIGLWGLVFSLSAAIASRVIEGHAEELCETLDSWAQLAYAAISTGELAARTAHEQRAALARLQKDVDALISQASDRSLSSGSDPANTLAIERAITSLGDGLARRLNRLVSEQVTGLRDSLGGAIERVGRDSSQPDQLAGAVAHLIQSSETQNAASRSLTQTTDTLSDTAEELRTGLDDFADVVTKMRETSSSLALASQRVDGSKAAGREQQERLDADIRDVRAAVQLLAEAIETRSSEPLLSNGGSSDWSEEISMLRTTTDSVANAIGEIAAAVGASDLPGVFELEQHGTGASHEGPDCSGIDHEASFPDARAPSIDGSAHPIDDDASETALATDAGRYDEPAPTTQTLAATTQTPRAMPATRPDHEMIYSEGSRRAGERTADSPPSEPEDDSSTLSGLLRPTHHSGPSSDQPKSSFDSSATLSLEPAEPGEESRRDREPGEQARDTAAAGKDSTSKQGQHRRRRKE